ncbi:type I-C CRISPR-associated protein Cas7/Csd2 [Cohnella xylanilytica]|uniref:Type I-C CRISPR-associated protein Cas7/Csd2 n=1 Tax=Cohnella xylanilytica TaxID=557555 RepID=A0A841U0F5_9BACL|nr:type I-C CRISPR-associated protein Cas7/Csd2 [Cohnella xylanilytica]MBB6694006.1 type I-C CRISPR-associated protein Cas7/Csd2 [Cohnella xylanilytica]GIO16513.1 type I-C CRISPR-associated protein Cas7/Csd2 [Cohnella xylanilytica]
MSEAIQKRYDFVVFFDVKDGNPNGDPDAGNLPRVDPETGHGLVTDVSLKRKVRNYVGLKMDDQPPYSIFVKEKSILNQAIEQAYISLNIDLNEPPVDPEDGKKRNKAGQGQGKEVDRARQFMCHNFFDIRTFGAVLSTGPNAGQVRGPVQLTFARSVDPVVSLEHGITRMAVATEAEAENQGGGNRTMGRKFTIPYGLYRAHGFVSAPLANQTGFSEIDLELLWESLENLFEHDRSAARGLMGTRKLIIFEHSSKMGNISVQKLFDAVTVKRIDENKPAREFSDYIIAVDQEMIPPSVKLIER